MVISTCATRALNHKVNKLNDGDYVEGKYLYADGILTHVKKKKALSGYTLFVGKIPNQNIIYDGKHYAHCGNLRDSVEVRHLLIPTPLDARDAAGVVAPNGLGEKFKKVVDTDFQFSYNNNIIMAL